jgi:uncharacterized heparinase superfamily protein
MQRTFAAFAKLKPARKRAAPDGTRPRLARLLRLPRRLVAERLLLWLKVRLLLLRPPAWLSRQTPTRQPLHMVPDAWPGRAAEGQAIVEGRFRLLGRTLADPQPPFRPLGAELGWQEALNGFGWLVDLRALGGDQARRRARELVALWIDEESRWSPAAWAPAVIGRRLSAWLGHYEFYAVSAEVPFQQAVLASIARQARLLARLLPAGLAGADAIAAIKGLALAGIACAEGEPWLAWAARLLERELPCQVLSDGGQAERSPAKHLEVLRDLVDLRSAFHAAGAAVPTALGDAIEQMAPVLRLLLHGDGAAALFNGSGECDALTAELVLQRASARQRPLLSAPQSGFQRLQAGRLAVIVDAGRPPPPGLDVEAAAGTLAFEVSLGRERMIVNCGAHAGDPAWRQALRATAAHSTLTLADHNSSELVPDGGLGRRPESVTCRREENDGDLWLDLSHDGYRPRFGVTHHRRLYLDATGDDLRGEERLEGGGKGLPFTLRFHLHPQVQASLAQGGGAALLRLPRGGGWRLRARGAEMSLETSVYLPEAGPPRRTLQLVLSGETQSGATLVQWALQREGRQARR